VTDQLAFELFTEPAAPALSRRTDPGAERLLVALVRHGGDAEALAGLVAELEEQTTPTGGSLQARPCRCDPRTLPVLDGFDVRCLLCGRGERSVW
jgi:hypothetical protein